MSRFQDPHRELYELARALRLHLEWQQHAGRYGIPGTPSPKPPAFSEEAAPTASAWAEAPRPRPEPMDMRAAAPSPRVDDGPSPRHPEPPYGEEQQQPGALGFNSMSAALASLLDSETKNTDRSNTDRSNADRPTLQLVRERLGDCRRCKLAPTRNQLVFGVGHPDATLMFIGEGPGEQEDRRGEPFVGPAGQLLDRMIAAMGWSRASVYIANVVKCRPPGNRDPEPDEVAQCEPFLIQQIAAVQPRVIITLGRPAAHLVLRTSQAIGRLRGRFHDYQGIPVMPTYHPAYLLRNPNAKRDTWDDLKQVIARLQQLGIRSPNPPRGQ